MFTIAFAQLAYLKQDALSPEIRAGICGFAWCCQPNGYRKQCSFGHEFLRNPFLFQWNCAPKIISKIQLIENKEVTLWV